MIRFLFAAITVTLSFSTAVHAHEGHDHGAEPHDHAAPDTNTPPVPPSDFAVPESRPLESGRPSNQERVPNFTPNPKRQRQVPPNSRDFQPQPLEFGAPSRPPGSIPSLNGRPSYTIPGRQPDRIAPGFEARPGDFGPQSSFPFGRSSYEQCPSAGYDSSCPNHYGAEVTPPCPFGRRLTEECPWGNGDRNDPVFDEFHRQALISFRCPTGRNGQTHGYQESRGIENYDNLSSDPSEQTTPYFHDDRTTPSPFRTFEERSPRTFGN